MIFTVIIKFLIENVIFIFGYISNGNLFPEPLSAKEEEMYFKLYKEGDEDVKKILIDDTIPKSINILLPVTINDAKLTAVVALVSKLAEPIRCITTFNDFILS